MKKGRIKKMKRKIGKGIYIGGALFLAFCVWTVLVLTVDVREVSQLGTQVGFGGINLYVADNVGVHMGLYELTDALSILPLGIVLGYALLGLVQLIKRKSLFKVDKSIIALGVAYAFTIACFLFFEVFVVNYRPLLIEGALEASYPSSTTLLVISVMLTAMVELSGRIKNQLARRITVVSIAAFSAFMVICRFISGVHWFSDIVGGILLGSAIVTVYGSVINKKDKG